MRLIQLNFDQFRDDPRYARWSSQIGGQPSWVWRFAALAAAFVIIVPIVTILMAAAATFVLVYLVLAGVHWIAESLRGLLGAGREGRRNVRVVRAER